MSDIRLTERLLEIIFYIHKSGSVTITDIYNHFDKKVPRRTLQTNLKNLTSVEGAYIPRINIVKDGRTYNYSMDKKYQMPFVQVDGDEVLALHALKNSLTVFKNTKIKDKVASLANKINQLVPKNVFMDVDYFKGNLGDISILETGTYDYSNHRKTINTLIEAISKRLKCKVMYVSEVMRKPDGVDTATVSSSITFIQNRPPQDVAFDVTCGHGYTKKEPPTIVGYGYSDWCSSRNRVNDQFVTTKIATLCLPVQQNIKQKSYTF